MIFFKKFNYQSGFVLKIRDFQEFRLCRGLCEVKWSFMVFLSLKQSPEAIFPAIPYFWAYIIRFWIWYFISHLTSKKRFKRLLNAQCVW